MTKEFKRASQLNKHQLRYIVSEIRDIDSRKLNKMSKNKLIPIVATISLVEIRDYVQCLLK
jgi:acetylglutamate kinase